MPGPSRTSPSCDWPCRDTSRTPSWTATSRAWCGPSSRSWPLTASPPWSTTPGTPASSPSRSRDAATRTCVRSSSKQPGPSVVEVRVQVYDPKLGRKADPSLGDELGWIPATDHVVVLSGSPNVVRGIDQGTKWTGRVTLPLRRGTNPLPAPHQRVRDDGVEQAPGLHGYHPDLKSGPGGRHRERRRCPRGARRHAHRSEPLLDKLGVKPERTRVAVLGLDDGGAFVQLLADADRRRLRRPPPGRARPDLRAVSTGREDLEPPPHPRAASSRRNGAIWALWPKGSKAINDNDVRDAALDAGLGRRQGRELLARCSPRSSSSTACKDR